MKKRDFIKTALLFCIAPRLTGNTQNEIKLCNWIGGSFLPRDISPSFENARANVLEAIELGLQNHNGTETILEFENTFTEPYLVETLLKQKTSIVFEEFEGLGKLISKIDSINHNPEEKIWWKFWINGSFATEGISTTWAQPGDKIKFVLSSALNDSITIEEYLGDYSRTIVTDTIPMWNGVFQSMNDWPTELGSVWYEFCTIKAPSGFYFIPQNISGTRYIEEWDRSTQTWNILQTRPFSMSQNDFIGKSFQNGIETRFDQSSDHMIWGGNGTGFSPLMQGGPEITRINQRLDLLRKGKARIRTVLNITLINSYSNEEVNWTHERLAFKDPVPFSNGEQLINPVSMMFETNENQAHFLHEIQKSQNLKDWDTHLWVSDTPSKSIPRLARDNMFFRVRRF